MTSRKLVLLGMMSKIPVAGVVWQTIHYLVGFQRLGFDVYYVEAHARTPSMFMESEADDASGKAAAFIDRVMRRFDLGGRWAFHALHEEHARCYGMSQHELKRLYASAELLINLHGGTHPLPEHAATGRLVYLETDPVQLQVELHNNLQETIDFLEPHCAFFTFAENLGAPDCKLPVPDQFDFKPTRQPVVLDFWRADDRVPRDVFTTVGNWKQPWRDVTFEGEMYSWSKHNEFLKFIEVPTRTGRTFELALAGCEGEDRRRLEEHGWRVRRADDLSCDLDRYRDYIRGSRAEFTVAKDQNVRLRTGWFSDRSATYLAAGRPVVTQDTGFSDALGTGEGLFAFSSADDVAAATEQIEGHYARHSRTALAIARESFDAIAVLSPLLASVGVEAAQPPFARRHVSSRIPPEVILEPVSRRPTTLREHSVDAVLARPIPAPHILPANPRVSVVVVTVDGLVFTRLCLESVLENTSAPRYELIVVDNGSSDGTREYLCELARRHQNVRTIFNGSNLGFPRAANQGLAEARGDFLVLLNNDTIVPPGWLPRLTRHLSTPSVGAVGPVTNRIGNEAQIQTAYRSYGEFLEFALDLARRRTGVVSELPMLMMFCFAMRADVFRQIGFLDERYGIGLVEDDDYAMRLRRAGLRSLCAEDVLVHHFGEASFGRLVRSGERDRVFAENRRWFEEKWRVEWRQHGRRTTTGYENLRTRVSALVERFVPSDATVLVISKGDDRLLRLSGRPALHFPHQPDGGYAGHYPADSDTAVAQLDAARARGARFLVVPSTALWWLDYYTGLREHLHTRHRCITRSDDIAHIFELVGGDG